jgi:hypothetical protein
MDGMNRFSSDSVWKMPEDHHELMAMCAPRALYVTGNPDYTWLSNPSCDVCSRACQRVYNALGVGDRFGFSVLGGHLHCQVPSNQIYDLGLMVDKFILGKDSISTGYVVESPYHPDLTPWITWSSAPIADNPTSVGNAKKVINRFDLQQNYPNPFNPTTTITFTLSRRDRVRVSIHNVLGELVATLVDDELAAGNHTVVWDGAHCASGTYFYTLTTQELNTTKCMVLLK